MNITVLCHMRAALSPFARCTSGVPLSIPPLYRTHSSFLSSILFKPQSSWGTADVQTERSEWWLLIPCSSPAHRTKQSFLSWLRTHVVRPICSFLPVITASHPKIHDSHTGNSKPQSSRVQFNRTNTSNLAATVVKKNSSYLRENAFYIAQTNRLMMSEGQCVLVHCEYRTKHVNAMRGGGGGGLGTSEC
jgi:hypothetical protein